LPTSEHWQIPWIVDLIVREQPATVLDLGAGYGKYGMLTREYVSPRRLDAVDIRPPAYPVYDHVYVGDIRNLDSLLPGDVPRYDLALFIDAIEHLDKPEAFELLDGLARRAHHLLVATPWGFRPQEIPGQPYETHRSGWYPWDFAGRYRMVTWRVFPGHFTKHLKLPRLWQLVVLLEGRETAPVIRPLRAAGEMAGS
jgi:hypothetical protein